MAVPCIRDTGSVHKGRGTHLFAALAGAKVTDVATRRAARRAASSSSTHGYGTARTAAGGEAKGAADCEASGCQTAQGGSRGCRHFVCASPVQRALTRDQAAYALEASVGAMRSAYAFAYGFECTSGNFKWLRRKVEEAVQGEEE